MKLLVILVFLLFVVLGSLGTWACRAKAIEDCRDRGGRPVTQPWWAADGAAKVGCVEAGGRR